MSNDPTIQQVDSLDVKAFTAFKESRLEFSEGLNVFIGENGTGKTHAMKLVYSLLRGIDSSKQRDEEWSKEEWRLGLAKKLVGVFLPDSLGRLTQRDQGRRNADVKLKYRQTGRNPERICHIKFATNASKKIKFQGTPPEPAGASTVFIPAREVLSIFPGFIAAYERRELRFDETFYDLCKDLNAAPLKPGVRARDIDELVEDFERELDVKVTKKRGQFYVRENRRGANLEAPLVAEGLRKLVTVLYLILNETISQSSMVFWDEPEANLNPKYSSVVADLLTKLAATGVQVFVATHDYVLTQKLSLYSEYRERLSETPDIQFFGFRFNEWKNVTVDRAPTLAELPENPILEEFDALYDQEMDLFEEAGE